MAKPSAAPVALTAVVLLLLAMTSSSLAAIITVRNQCPIWISVCQESLRRPATCFALSPRTGARSMNVGRVWESAIISGFRGNNANVQQGIQAKPQANLAEFTLGLNNMDKYDLSNVVRGICKLLIAESPTSQWLTLIT
nr:uncharacterized protein LOC112284469 [Physcomitrium patens]|eukprot:XP_024380054.1 uncharacterized protein LOC112284469 [Physcomitrella patens]